MLPAASPEADTAFEVNTMLPSMPTTPVPQVRGEPREQATARLLALAHSTEDEGVRRAALDHAVVVNLALARSLAARHRHKGIPLEDLEQVASSALVKAVHRFDPERQHDFLSFAVPTIRGELKRHFRDCGWTVRPPRRVQEIQLDVLSAQAEMARDVGRPPSPAAIAERLGETEPNVIEALRVDGCFQPASLDTPVGDGTAAVGDLLASPDDREQEEAEARVVLAPVVRALGQRDRRILEMRFFEGLTQREIGDELGVTQMQVSRLLTRILRNLRRTLSGATETS